MCKMLTAVGLALAIALRSGTGRKGQACQTAGGADEAAFQRTDPGDTAPGRAADLVANLHVGESMSVAEFVLAAAAQRSPGRNAGLL